MNGVVGVGGDVVHVVAVSVVDVLGVVGEVVHFILLFRVVIVVILLDVFRVVAPFCINIFNCNEELAIIKVLKN